MEWKDAMVWSCGGHHLVNCSLLDGKQGLGDSLLRLGLLLDKQVPY